ncbi:hypothetical protein [Roseivirga pacifica]|uniref:hypothetical protein n=1 Tax=Roseivirga pacifica TaxID=1267423 RepID=UPI003BB038D2
MEKLLSSQNKRALKELKSILDPVWSSPKTGDLPAYDKRVTLSLSKDKASDEFSICVHVAKKTKWISEEVLPIVEKYDSVFVVSGNGEVQASYPQSKDVFMDHATDGRIKPGSSISHGRYRSGTIGCIVEVGKKDEARVYVLTASHVLASNQANVEENDFIYSPGKGSVNRIIRKYRIGKLSDNMIEIFPEHDNETKDEDIELDIDVALVKLDRKHLVSQTLKTVVPDPQNKSEEIHVTKVVSEDNIHQYVGDEVYIFGAVSGLRKGILSNIYADRMAIKLPNGKKARYKELFAVTSIDNTPFSRPGDSGGIIYTKKGELLGFLVGANRYASYACIGERCLTEFDARLI